MNVVPDVLPSFHPSFDLRVTFPQPPPQIVHTKNRANYQNKQVEPGVFLVSEQVRHHKRSLHYMGSSLTNCLRPANSRRFTQPFFMKKQSSTPS